MRDEEASLGFFLLQKHGSFMGKLRQEGADKSIAIPEGCLSVMLLVTTTKPNHTTPFDCY